jgi:hypothetical protein
LRESTSPIQTRKPDEHIYSSVSRKYLNHLHYTKRLYATLSDPATGLESSLHISPIYLQGLSLWLALQDLVPLLPFPLTRMQNILSRASLPAMMITVSSAKVLKTLPGIHKDLIMLPILEDLPTATSAIWSCHFHTMPIAIDGQGHKNLS